MTRKSEKEQQRQWRFRRVGEGEQSRGTNIYAIRREWRRVNLPRIYARRASYLRVIGLTFTCHASEAHRRRERWHPGVSETLARAIWRFVRARQPGYYAITRRHVPIFVRIFPSHPPVPFFALSLRITRDRSTSRRALDSAWGRGRRRVSFDDDRPVSRAKSGRRLGPRWRRRRREFAKLNSLRFRAELHVTERETSKTYASSWKEVQISRKNGCDIILLENQRASFANRYATTLQANRANLAKRPPQNDCK